MLVLTFNKEAFTQDFAQYLMIVCDEIADDMLSEMKRKFMSSKAKEDIEKLRVRYKENLGVIYSDVVSYAYAIVDSYGTGEYMLDTNFLSDYINSTYWNSARTGKTIVGRPSGSYKNIFGEKVTSSGAFEGEPLTFNGSQLKGIQPTNAIGNTETVFFTSRVQTRLDRLVPQWIEDNAYKYFANKER